MAAAAAEVSAAKAAKAAAKPKAPVFGVQEAPAEAGDIFTDSGPGDLAIARKLERLATATPDGTISHS